MKRPALDKRINRLYVLLMLTVAYYAVPWTSIPAAGVLVGLPFLLFYTVFVPGAAIDRFLTSDRPAERADRDALESVAAWAFHGFAVLLMGAFVWTVSGVSVTVFARSLPVVVAAIALAAPPVRRGVVVAAGAAPGRTQTITIAYGVFVAVVTALVLWTGPIADFDKDTLDHVAYTNEIAWTGDPFPTTAFYQDPGANGADLRKGLLHSLYGYYKWYLGVESLAMFRVIGAVFLALVLLAVYTTTRTFFGNRLVAALAGVLFVLAFDGGIRSEFIRAYFYTNRFAVGYMLLFLAAAMGFLQRPRPRALVLCAVYAFAAAAVHIQYTVLLGFAVFTILIWKPCFDTGTLRTHVGRAVALGVAAFMGMLPYAVFRFTTGYQASGLHKQFQGVVFITDDLFVADPVHVWQRMGLLGLAAFLAIVPLWKRRLRYPALGYLIASALTVLLIQLNPFVMPVVYHAITYLAFRLDMAFPFYIMTAYLLVAGLGAIRPGEAWGRYRRVALAVAVLAVVAGVAPVFTGNSFSPGTIEAERSRSAERWADGLAFLNELPGREVIASDPVTSYIISAYTPHYVVCTFDQHAPPNDLMSRQRTIAARDILSPFTSASDKTNQMTAHDATYVVVNEDIGLYQLSDYWTVGDRSLPLVLGRIGALGELYEEVGGAGGFRVYRWTGRSPRHVRAVRNPLLRRRVPDDATPVGESAGLGRCEAAEIRSPDPVPRGEEIEVILYWSREKQQPLDKYMVSIRFDRTDLELPFGGKPFPKLARKFKERLAGERYRFRNDHKIVDGFFDPDAWPAGVYVVDRTTVTIPRDVEAGRYTVRAKLLTRATLPNHRFRDFLYDDDVYHGVEIGEITVSNGEQP
jgi:hypothetical protein